MEYIDIFNFDNSTTIEINDGCIKSIIVENEATKDFVKIEDNELRLPTGGNTIIEFINGKKILISNSEWCSFNWL